MGVTFGFWSLEVMSWSASGTSSCSAFVWVAKFALSAEFPRDLYVRRGVRAINRRPGVDGNEEETVFNSLIEIPLESWRRNRLCSIWEGMLWRLPWWVVDAWRGHLANNTACSAMLAATAPSRHVQWSFEDSGWTEVCIVWIWLLMLLVLPTRRRLGTRAIEDGLS